MPRRRATAAVLCLGAAVADAAATPSVAAVADRTFRVHHDGQIWSRALWDIRAGYVGIGRTTEDWDRTLVDSQFDYAPDTTWADAARATYDRALAADGKRAAMIVRDSFAARGISF
jgi:hypothetical protein